MLTLPFQNFILFSTFLTKGKSYPIPLSNTFLFHTRASLEMRDMQGLGDFGVGGNDSGSNNKFILLLKENKYINLHLKPSQCIQTDIGSVGFKFIKEGKALGEEMFLVV